VEMINQSKGSLVRQLSSHMMQFFGLTNLSVVATIERVEYLLERARYTCRDETVSAPD
jgi:hypothetical protein